MVVEVSHGILCVNRANTTTIDIDPEAFLYCMNAYKYSSVFSLCRAIMLYLWNQECFIQVL